MGLEWGLRGGVTGAMPPFGQETVPGFGRRAHHTILRGSTHTPSTRHSVGAFAGDRSLAWWLRQPPQQSPSCHSCFPRPAATGERGPRVPPRRTAPGPQLPGSSPAALIPHCFLQLSDPYTLLQRVPAPGFPRLEYSPACWPGCCSCLPIASWGGLSQPVRSAVARPPSFASYHCFLPITHQLVSTWFSVSFFHSHH